MKKVLMIALAGAVLACAGSAFAARPSSEVVPFVLHKQDASPPPVLAAVDANYSENTKLAALADAHKAFSAAPTSDAVIAAKSKKATGAKKAKSKVAQVDPEPKEMRRPGVSEGLEKLVGS